MVFAVITRLNRKLKPNPWNLEHIWNNMGKHRLVIDLDGLKHFRATYMNPFL